MLQEVYSELGVQVNWDGFQAVEIQLTNSYQNKTCGLCGDYNQNPDDDWRLGPECDVTGEIVSRLCDVTGEIVSRHCDVTRETLPRKCDVTRKTVSR